MNTLTLKLEDNRTSYRPGEVVQAVAGWTLERPPPSLTLRLFWHIPRMGFPETCEVDAVVIERPPRADERRCTLTLPAGPYSFTGKWSSLHWIIELVVEGLDVYRRVDLTVSPTGERIRLDKGR